MALKRIRAIIAGAIAAEARSGAFADSLQQRLPQLREKLILPEREPVAALMTFTTDYVRSVPAGLRVVSAISRRQGFYEYAEPFLDVAMDYFLHPPDDVHDNALQALLDEAFLAHRLLEEVNDHHVRQLQRPLLPVDMTEANIIVHHLLGDHLASRLDQLVQLTAAQLLGKEHVWDEVKAITAEAGPPIVLSSSRISRSPQPVRLRLAS